MNHRVELLVAVTPDDVVIPYTKWSKLGITAIWSDVTWASHVVVTSNQFWNAPRTGYLPLLQLMSTSAKLGISRVHFFCFCFVFLGEWTKSMSADLSVLTLGSRVAQREDLARLQRAARCEEDDFHRVPLQQPAKALWSTAVRPRLWPHEQVGFLETFFLLLHKKHNSFHCTAVRL